MAQKVTVDEMVTAIGDADKPLTEKEIGEKVGVSRPTVASYRDELQSRPEVQHGEVGGSRAYWMNTTPEGAMPPAGGMADEEMAEGSAELVRDELGESETEGGPKTDSKSVAGAEWGESAEVTVEGEYVVNLPADHADAIRQLAEDEGLSFAQAFNEATTRGIANYESGPAREQNSWAEWLVGQMYRVGSLSVRLSVATLFVSLMLLATTEAAQAVSDAAVLSVSLAVLGAVLIIAAVGVRVAVWDSSIADELPWESSEVGR